jgi:hypothetical protein
MTDGYGVEEVWVFAQRIKVDDDTVRGTNFVLAAVALADVAIVIPGDITKFLFEKLKYTTCFVYEFWLVLEER